MARDVTLTFNDGTSHVYAGVPDTATPDQVTQRASTEFPGKTITNIDGGKAASAPTAQQPPPGIIQRLLRQGGLTARYAVEGAASPFAAVGDLLGQNTSQGVSSGLTALGLPQPQGTEERLVGDMARGVASVPMGVGIGGAMEGAINPVVRGIGAALQSGPGGQAVSAAAGGLSSGVAQESGAGPITQFLAGLAGGVLPSAPGMVKEGFQRAVQGGATNIPRIRGNIDTFKDAGTTPSAGQATQTRMGQATESVLSKVVGGAGPMAAKATAQAEQIGKQADFLAKSIGNADEATAGDIIEKGLSSSSDSFRRRFVAAGESLFDKIDKWLPPTKMVSYSNLQQTLGELNADIPNAAAVSQIFKRPEIVSLEAKIKQDAISNRTPGTPPTVTQNPPMVGAPDEVIPVAPTVTPGTPPGPPSTDMPYLALKKIRTVAGQEMADINSSATLRDKWKTVYAAASRDMQAAVDTAGPQAKQAFSRANKFWYAGMNRMEKVLDSVTKQKIPEQVYNAAISGVASGPSRINAVMRSLQPAERDVVRAKFINDLGMAKPGQQGAAGDTFSTQTFLTNWNKIHPKAKMILFAGDNGNLRSSLDAIAKAAENIKKGSSVFSNASGTAPAAYMIGETAGVASSVLTQLMMGSFHTAAATVVGAAGSAYLSNSVAKLMTSPEFVNSLAKAIKSPPGRQAAILQAGFASLPDDKERAFAISLLPQQ